MANVSRQFKIRIPFSLKWSAQAAVDNHSKVVNKECQVVVTQLQGNPTAKNTSLQNFGIDIKSITKYTACRWMFVAETIVSLNGKS